MIFSEKQHSSFHFSSVVVFVFLLPFYQKLSAFAFLFITLNWLISGKLWQNYKQVLRPLPLLFIAFYLLHLYGMLFTQNMQEGWSDLETKFSILLAPFIFFTFPIVEKTKIRKVFMAFVIGCLIAAWLALIFSLISYFELNDGRIFSYAWLSNQVGHHPTFLGTYMSFAFFILIFNVEKKWEQLSGKKKLAGIIALLFLLLIIALLTSRIVILAFAMMIFVYAIAMMFLQNKKKNGLLVMSSIGLLFLFVQFLPTSNERFDQTIKDATLQDQRFGRAGIRSQLWSAGVQAIKVKPLFGHGTGDVHDVSLATYQSLGYEAAFNAKLNVHNQYLQTTIALGLIGGLLLLACFLVPGFIFLKRQNYLYLYFIAIIMIAMMTESFIEKQAGVLLYAFFNSFIISSELLKEENTRLLNKSHEV